MTNGTVIFTVANGTATFTVLLVPSIVALLATAAIAYFLGPRLKRPLSAVLIAGFAVPTAIMMVALYVVATDGPDGPPPGMVLLGAMFVGGVLTPITLLVSGLAVRHARR